MTWIERKRREKGKDERNARKEENEERINWEERQIEKEKKNEATQREKT